MTENDESRATWSRKIDFLLACIGFSVGLGNVWRFPYLCYNNGGGAFLIPYFFSVLVGGIPIFFLEVALGQFMSRGGIEAWNICPLFKGIGFASAMVVLCLNCYYNVILAWALYYLFASFTATLPWSNCNNAWNTDYCIDDWNTTIGNTSTTFTHNNVTVFLNGSRKLVDPVAEYWEYDVLHLSDGIDKPGTLNWKLTLYLLLAWAIVYFCIWKGIKTSGKVMYFTATSPYLLMLILFIRAATLEGSSTGIYYYLVPTWERLGDFKAWVDGGTQIFFSYSLALGTLTALGSYNKFHHNSFRDTVIFALVNSGTSFFAGFVIFMTLGYMSHVSGIHISKVAESGPGLAFIAYPKALAQMPISPLWSILFFIMIMLLGLDSQFVGVEGFVTAVSDIFPQLHKSPKREIFILGVCIFSFFIGLSMISEGGMYVFQLFDYYSGSRIILLIAFFECVAIAYGYGINRFMDNIKMMYGFSLGIVPKIMWCVITPIFTLVIFAMSAVTYSNLTYERSTRNETYTFPSWSVGIGWTLAGSSIVLVPLYAIIAISQAKGNLSERISYLLRPQLKVHQLRPEDDVRDLAVANGDLELEPVKNDSQERVADPAEDTRLRSGTESSDPPDSPPPAYDVIRQY